MASGGAPGRAAGDRGRLLLKEYTERLKTAYEHAWEIRDAYGYRPFEDYAQGSPLKHKNLNVLGRYSFTATQPASGTLRLLRDPDAAGLDDEDGAED